MSADVANEHRRCFGNEARCRGDGAESSHETLRILNEQKVLSQLAVDTRMQRSAINKLLSLPVRASFVEPMECLTVARLPEGSQWLWEIKLDGYRALAVKSGSAVTLFSRRGKPLNRQFPHIVERLADLPDGTVVDGELVPSMTAGDPTSTCYRTSVPRPRAFTTTFSTFCAARTVI